MGEVKPALGLRLIERRVGSGSMAGATMERGGSFRRALLRDQTRRSTIFCFNSAMALPGFSPFGQTCAQFKMVWQR